ncbi:MAG: hypothetical protein PHG53_09495 [Phycisphaerae bacterium]|nr:hypothetical protein [Phycisphaerae bacterium]
MNKVLILTVLLLVAGCKEVHKSKEIATATDPNTDPMSVLLKPNQQWIDEYGDSKESQIIFTLVRMNKVNGDYHVALTNKILDANDPNSVESRLRKLEPKDINDPNTIK